MSGDLHIHAENLNILNFSLNNFYLDLPNNLFGAEKISFYQLSVNNIKGILSDITQGQLSFSFYGGTGVVTYNIEDLRSKPPVSFNMQVNNINISKLIHDLNEEIYVSGFLNAEGKGSLNKDQPQLDIVFESRKKSGVKQVMNFGAIKVISSLSGSPVKSFGTSDFPYSIIKGRAIINDGYLTIEGRAGRKGEQDILIKKGLFKGINLFIDRRFNSIKIDDLQRRIMHAVETMKK